MIYIILFVTILGILLFKMFELINIQFKSPEPVKSKTNFTRPRKTDLTEIYKDIYLEPYGCFSSLDEKFFSKQINPYAAHAVLDSGIIISENDRTKDTKELIQRVMNNGFETFAFKMLHKYDSDPDGYSKNMSIKELAILGKLAGYNYLSVYKIDLNTRGTIYLTYSPPMDYQTSASASKEEIQKNLTKSDLPKHTLTPKLDNYTNEHEKAPGKELSCGYPCLPNDKPLTLEDNGVTKQYMCGSASFPNVKSPPKFAVYHIVEKI